MARGKNNKKSKYAEKQLAESAEELALEPLSNKDAKCDSDEEATTHSKEEKCHYFWQSGSPFSQWHNSKYELNGVVYYCAEQGMMHGKALLFGDNEIAQQIMETRSPRTMKKLGRKVRYYNDEEWKKNRDRIVYDNSIAKFTQNRHLLQALMKTQGLLVEASPCDKIWGIGLAEATARITPRKNWPGLNLLGEILTRVRDEIRTGVHNSLIKEEAVKE